MRKTKQVLPRLKIWMLRGFKITPLMALDMFKTTRLSSYIHRLRNEPHCMKIDKTIKTKSDGTQICTYFLKQAGKRKTSIS